MRPHLIQIKFALMCDPGVHKSGVNGRETMALHDSPAWDNLQI